MSGLAKAAILLSGSGRTLENLLAKIAAGQLPLEIAAVVSSRAQVRGVDIAREHDLPVAVFPRRNYPDVAAHNLALNDWLAAFAPQMVVLAGYLGYYIKPEGFSGPVVNIHPALLPKYGGKGFYGDRVHRAVLAAGEAETGCTVHLVDAVYDNGQVLGQRRVSVLPNDTVETLAARVFQAECELYPEVLSRLAADLI